MTSSIKAVVFDWAGTIVDYGSMAPVKAFKEVFEEENIDLTNEEIRMPMGLPKRDHIQKLFDIPRVSELWIEKYHRNPHGNDIERLYQAFEAKLFEILPDFSKPVPGAVQTVNDLRQMGLKIGSTTGYTIDMIKMVSDKAKTFGYEPDTIVTPDDLPGGRPYPWMCYQTAINLQVYPMSHMIKVGDTVNDIEEGKNAGMRTVGVIKGSSALGLSNEETGQTKSEDLEERMKKVEADFYEGGADFVIGEISELIRIIKN